jgi:hypothetical protein
MFPTQNKQQQETLTGESIIGNQPVQDELSFQLDMAMKRAARDIEFSFLRGSYVADTNVGTARKTRGMLISYRY